MGCMMFILIFSAVLVLQGRSGSLAACKNDNTAVFAKAKDALRVLEKILEGVTNIALETVESLQNALQDVQVVIAANVKVVVDELGDEIFDHLAEIKKEASAIGVNIINCTEDREKDIKQLFVDFYNKTTECAVERIDEVLDSFRAILNDIQKGNSEFKNLTQRMDDCGKDVACMEQVIQEIAKVIQEMPNTVMGDIKKANKKTNELINYLYECYHDKYNEMEVTAQEIFNGIVECVENEIVNSTSPKMVWFLDKENIKTISISKTYVRTIM